MIKLGLNSASSIYQSTKNSTNSLKKKSETKSKIDSRDTIELSAESKDALSKMNQNNKSEDYDLGRVLEMHKKSKKQFLSKEESDYYFNARKNNRELDAQLYDQDKANAIEFMMRIDSILMKVFLGEKLTDEEQKILNREMDVNLPQKI